MTISEELRKLGECPVFLIQEDTSKRFLPEFSSFIQLKKHSKINSEIREIKETVTRCGAGKLLLDSYQFHDEYMRAVRGFFEKTITFDDMGQEIFSVDMIINYDLYYEKFHYWERYRNDKTKLLLGGAYVPLRAQFQNVKPSRRELVRNVVLICGGSGYLGFLAKIVKMICKVKLYKRYHFTVICGMLNFDCRGIIHGLGRFVNLGISPAYAERRRIVK